MKFGVNTFIWADRFGPEQFPLLAKIKDTGFDGVEVPMFMPDDLADSAAQRAIRQSGLECTVCSVIPRSLSLVSDDTTIWKKTVEHLRRCATTCAELGAKVMAGPLYSPVGYLPGRRRTDDEWNRVVNGYGELTQVLESTGISIAIEPLNRYETYFLNTTADAVRLCSEIGHKQVGLLFDTYHANIEEKSIGDAIRQAGDHLLHFHSCENDRGVPGTGHVNWSEVFASLHAIKYDSWMTIESFGFSVGALSAAASIWRDLAPNAEDIAFDGIRFLKNQ